ncbi:MAG: ankyrin repeat domain-containing protein [Bryobacteraceae bacterium]|nr:ankyrin repeat domain-containing protein [Bryobacteraceae bacterium]
MMSGPDFFTAIRNGDEPALRRLVDRSPQLLTTRTAEGASPVLYALYARKPHLVPLLMAPGARLDLYEACAVGDLAQVRRRLGEAPAESFSPDGFTPLGLAAYFGHYEVAVLLLQHGAHPATPSNNKLAVAPLHSAVENGDPRLVRLLLQHHAPVDPVEFLGATPLHAAAVGGKRGIAEILLAHGANRQAVTRDGKTPSQLAAQYGHKDLAAFLLE